MVVVPETVVARLVRLVEDNPPYALVRIRETRVMSEGGIAFEHQPHCTSLLDKQWIRVKKLYDVPVERNIEVKHQLPLSQRVGIKTIVVVLEGEQSENANWYTGHGVQRTCIFVDLTFLQDEREAAQQMDDICYANFDEV